MPGGALTDSSPMSLFFLYVVVRGLFGLVVLRSKSDVDKDSRSSCSATSSRSSGGSRSASSSDLRTERSSLSSAGSSDAIIGDRSWSSRPPYSGGTESWLPGSGPGRMLFSRHFGRPGSCSDWQAITVGKRRNMHRPRGRLTQIGVGGMISCPSVSSRPDGSDIGVRRRAIGRASAMLVNTRLDGRFRRMGSGDDG